MKRLPLVFLVLLILTACGTKEPQKKAPAKPNTKLPASELNIWALKRLRSSGLEGTLIRDFAKRFNCKVNLRMFGSLPALLDSLKTEQETGNVDLVMNLDSSFCSDEEIRALFQPLTDLGPLQLSRDLMIDPQKRLIPYGYANLGIVYNSKVFSQGPQSFGELQDARYFRQLGICDPESSPEGRSSLYWSLALFGTPGYEFLWKSIRKNIKQVYPSYEEALQALRQGSVSMLVGYNTTPAWLEETQQSDKSFQFSTLKEGSWQYSELAGIPVGATQTAMASRFIRHLIEPDAQLMIIYKLGLFPANSKTMLPIRFARIPISSFTVNRRLSEAQIKESLPAWMEFWGQLFDYNLPDYD